MAAEWRECKLGDVIELKRGYDLPEQDRRSGMVPLVSSSGISDYISEFKVKGPGVVTGRYGTLGEVFYIDEDFWPLNTTLYVRDFKGNHPRFISYFLRGLDFLAYSDKAAVPGLNRNHLHQAKVRIPAEVEEQKRIAAILETLDDRIELNTRMNETLDAMAQALFKSWFVDFDHVRMKLDGRLPVGVDRATAGLFPANFQDSSLGPIPQGWTVGTIDDATSLIIDYRGKTPKKLRSAWAEAGIPAISAKNVKGGRLVRSDSFNFVDEALFDRWMKDKLAVTDILMTSEAPLGELYYLALDARLCLSQRVFGLRANRARCEPIFLYYWLSSPSCQAELRNRATGTTVVGIRQTELRKVSVLFPPPPIQLASAAFLADWTERIQRSEKESQTLAAIRDALLPKLVSGEIRLKHAERQVEVAL